MTAGLLSGAEAAAAAAAAKKAAEEKAKARRAKAKAQRKKRDNCKTKCDPKKVEDRYGSVPQSQTDKMNEKAKKPLKCPYCGHKSPFGDYIGRTGDFPQLSPDHIVPCKEIMKKPGFCCLSDKNKQKVLNNPNNLRLICPSCNSSKLAKDLKDWKGHGKFGMTKAGETFKKEMLEKAPGLSKNLGAQITRLL